MIEAYDGYNRMAMFRSWNKDESAVSAEIFRPDSSDKYMIYLDKKVLGGVASLRPRSYQSVASVLLMCCSCVANVLLMCC